MLTLLVAAAENNVIGVGNQLPWHLPADLRRFKQITLGHPMVMGRKTFESIGRPLPERTSIVVTRQASWPAPAGVVVCHSVPEAVAAAQALDEQVFVVGGAEIYQQSLPLADRVLLTRVHVTLPGDAYFPDLPATQWQEVSREDFPADERHAYPYSFLDLRPVASSQ